MLGNGNGGFISVLHDTIGNFSGALCTADFNNDGKPDLVSYDYGPAVGTLLLGDGTGGFAVSTLSFGSIFNPASSLCAGDFNNDGNADLAMSSGFGSMVILIGNGNGTFGSPVNIAATSTVYGELVSGDFNNDGKVDLATLSTVMLGNGAGSFASSYTFNPINHPRSLVVGDVNNDGKQDIITINSGVGSSTGYEGSVTSYIGDGVGNFTASIDYSLGDSVVPFQDRYQICAGDFDGDSKLDIAMGTWTNKVGANTSNINIMVGNGLGGFIPSNVYAIPNYPHAILQQDLNADGRADIALLHRESSDSTKMIILLSCNVEAVDDKIDLENLVQLFPNPNKGEFIVRSEQSIEEINVINQLGQLIQSLEVNKNVTNLHILQSGFYMLQIKTSDKIILKKVMIE